MKENGEISIKFWKAGGVGGGGEGGSEERGNGKISRPFSEKSEVKGDGKIGMSQP